MMRDVIRVSDPREAEAIARLAARDDFEARRIRHLLAMPDLSRKPGNPLFEMVERVKNAPSLKAFDIVEIPEIVPASVSFDLFNFEPDHPARSKSDTYYVDEGNILRTHDTVFWYYYLTLPEIKERIARNEKLGTLCYGKVYRKDEIDRRHMNVFHQMGGWYLVPDSEETLSLDNLKNVLSEVVKSVFGPDITYRFTVETFPYTDPSLEVEVQVEGEWVEIVGGGMPKKAVLKNMGVEGYNGWAFGFGLERLAMISMRLPDIRLLWSEDERVKQQLVLGRAFTEVSKYPSIIRDISFVVSKDFIPNNYFDLIRDLSGDLVEEVKLLDRFENAEKFGADKVSYTFRITYQSHERTLTNEEVNAMQETIIRETRDRLSAVIR